MPDDGSVEVVGGGSDELEVLCSGAAEAGGGPDGNCIKSTTPMVENSAIL